MNDTTSNGAGLDNTDLEQPVGFIGLGDLGRPMARNLLASGYKLKVYNRTASKAEAFAALGAQVAERPRDAVMAGGVVLTIVSDDDALESIVNSEGFLEGLGSGGVHLSMSTVSPELAQKLAALHAEHGSVYVEAPVFGRPEAAARELWICLAGPTPEKARVRPLLEALSQGIYDFGEAAGAAVTVKLSGNFLIISAWLAMSEALSLVKKSGVAPTKVIDMLSRTLFPAPVYQSYGKMIALDPEHLKTNWIGPKDIGLFKDLALQVESPTDLVSLLQERLQTAERID